ncbi:hypothetical protein [Inhella sp.]|uniref:hypothetical protein n=1 Tax=Inhella sp. TaxID=1921806 RepID=UPI0035B4F4A0
MNGGLGQDQLGGDDDEQIERAIYLPPGFPYLELLTLAQVLEVAEVFTPGYGPPSAGLCHPMGFLYEHHFERRSTILLPDRNVASRFAQIAKGAQATDDLRQVAAIKAFCHFLDILVEPSIAFYELAQKQGNAVANEELAWFRIGDNGDAFDWFDYAIGEIDRIPPSTALPRIGSQELAFPLRRWRRNYIVALKIAELELSSIPNLQRMLTLLEWMHNDFIVAGPAAMLACIYFAPNSPPRKGLLKQLRSPDRQRALDGVRNAAWDITHLSDFIKKVNEAEGGSTRYLFASADKALHRMAKFLFEFSANGIRIERLIAGLAVWWPPNEAERIAACIVRLLDEASNSARAIHTAQRAGFIDHMIARGEEAILTWRNPLKGRP